MEENVVYNLGDDIPYELSSMLACIELEEQKRFAVPRLQWRLILYKSVPLPQQGSDSPR
jgi:hypothetical protein